MDISAESGGPVFVVGMNGSGTTMLVDSLGHHPELYGFPRETRVLPSLLGEHPKGSEPKTRAEKAKLWDQIRGNPAFRGVNQGEPAPLPDGWEDINPGVPEIFGAIIGQYVKAAGKSRWIEKTPNHVQHMPLLAAAFPDATFIHIIRDGRACAASFWRRWGRTPELTMYRWKRLVAKGRRDGEKLGDRYFELRYEDLTADPEKWMRDLCAFLGVVYTPDVLASRQPQSEHSGETGRIAKSTPKWREQLSGRCVARLEEIGGVMLETLGYPVDGVPGDAEIGRLRRAWWSSIDYSRQYWHEVQGKLSGESGRSWSIVWRLPMVALRQRRTNKY